MPSHRFSCDSWQVPCEHTRRRACTDRSGSILQGNNDFVSLGDCLLQDLLEASLDLLRSLLGVDAEVASVLSDGRQHFQCHPMLESLRAFEFRTEDEGIDTALLYPNASHTSLPQKNGSPFLSVIVRIRPNSRL